MDVALPIHNKNIPKMKEKSLWKGDDGRWRSEGGWKMFLFLFLPFLE